MGRVDRFDLVSGTLTVSAALTTALLTPLVRGADGTIRPWLLVIQIVGVFVTAAIPTVATIRAKAAERAAEAREAQVRVQSRVEMNEGLDPIVRKLGQLSVAPNRRAKNELRAQVMSLTVAAASQVVCRKPGVRACFFELQPGPPKQLAPTEHHYGRVGSTRSTFVEGTAAGDAAIGMVERNETRICQDVLVDPPPGWDGKKRDYRTFVSASVVAGDSAYGMLTVDALEPGDLSSDDVDVLRVLAGLLAVSLQGSS